MLLQGMAIIESLYFGLGCADSLIRQSCDKYQQKKPQLKILEEVQKIAFQLNERKNVPRILKNMTHMQGCTTCGSLPARPRENGEIMRKLGKNGERMRKWRENEEMERESLSVFSLYLFPLYPFPISKILSFCSKMLNTAFLSRMSQKT